MKQSIAWTTMPSPIGDLTLVRDQQGLSAILFSDDERQAELATVGACSDAHGLLGQARRELEEYFRGERTTFETPLSLRGTPFQVKVWSALRTIPFAATASYGEIAVAIGAPRASRAVGGANHRNPVPIIVPCHRVIGADGSLTGYGGGHARKQRLLDLERHEGPRPLVDEARPAAL